MADVNKITVNLKNNLIENYVLPPISHTVISAVEECLYFDKKFFRILSTNDIHKHSIKNNSLSNAMVRKA